jgi:hypothetical protein
MGKRMCRKSFTSIVEARKARKAALAGIMDPSDVNLVRVETKGGEVTRTVVY